MGRKDVTAATPFGGTPLRDALALAILPFVVLSFVLIACGEIVYETIRRFWKGKSALPSKRSGLRGEQPVDVFDPDSETLDWERLREEYVDMGVPFVLRRAGGARLSSARPPAAAVSAAFTDGRIRVSAAPFFTRYDGIDCVVARLFPDSMRAYWPFWFLGRYSEGKAHVDLGPTTVNCYFLRSGAKDVAIVPPEVTRTTPLLPGLDGLFVEGSEVEGRAWTKKVAYHYRVRLEPQSLLVFNNATSIHQFRNIYDEATGRAPEALSIRIKHCVGADSRVWRHLLSDTRMWWRFTTVAAAQLMQEESEERDPKYL